MAAPNIGSTASSVFLRVASGPVATATGTNSTLIVSCGATSSTVLRVTRLDIANIDGSNAADISILRFDGTNATTMISTVSVPADATLRVYDNEGSLAVTEGQDIRAIASAADDLTFDAEYQEFA
jgi:hypothetical protein